MEEFIQSAVKQFGIDEGIAKNATGTALGFLKNGLGDQFSAIADKIPGVGELITQADSQPDSDSSGGGLLGAITDAASGLLGGAGEGLELMDLLKKSGLSTEQGGSFITMLIEFIKDQVGDDIFNQIADKIPVIKNFV